MYNTSLLVHKIIVNYTFNNNNLYLFIYLFIFTKILICLIIKILKINYNIILYYIVLT